MDEVEKCSKTRAWVEINLENLEHNIKEIKKNLSDKTKIMAVVKANAYGHDSLLIASKLSSIGICDFAVATLEEGIFLRKNNISGNILILGYTSLESLKYVTQYDLIQTIVDYDYSEAVKELPLDSKLKCHIKINTGMNRIGEKYDDFPKLSKIYENEKLEILGTFSHLCVADSSTPEDIEFTKNQIEHFNTCINHLKELGYSVGKVHLQSSYGTLNYPDLEYDYVRMGILMYGVPSAKDSYHANDWNVKPVLSLNARITSIREINDQDSVSYGRTYVAAEPRKIASVSIGYADGIPRNLSNLGMVVKVRNQLAKVIGRICMDQLVIDITDLHSIHVGDIVSLIDSKDDTVSAVELSEKAGTITNELLCRLGERLPRIES